MPILVEGHRKQFYGFISGEANLTCEVIAEPEAEFQWLDKNNKNISKEKTSQDGNKSILTVGFIVQYTFILYIMFHFSASRRT